MDWYVVENKEDINTFLDMFWGLHDFRITGIVYDPKLQRVEIKLEYDTHDLWIKLLFINVTQMHIVANYNYECSWLDGAYMRKDGAEIVWFNSDYAIRDDELPNDVTWVKAGKMLFAVTNDAYEPIPLSDEMTHQTWHELNYETMQYEDSYHEFFPRKAGFDDV